MQLSEDALQAADGLSEAVGALADRHGQLEQQAFKVPGAAHWTITSLIHVVSSRHACSRPSSSKGRSTRSTSTGVASHRPPSAEAARLHPTSADGDSSAGQSIMHGSRLLEEWSKLR